MLTSLMKEDSNTLWQKLAMALKPQVSADTFKRWFSAVELIDANDKALTFRVPNNIYQFWIESNHMTALQAAIITAVGSPRQVKFSLPSGSPAQIAPEDVAALKEMPDPPRESRSGAGLGLNPRNTFESFVVGPNNEIRRTRPRSRSRSHPRALTTHFLSMAASVWARPI